MSDTSASSPPDLFRLVTLGETVLRREIDGATPEVVLQGGKVIALLIYLACQEGRPVARDLLADLLWGDESPEHARASLRQALYSLRRLIGDAVRTEDRQRVSVASDQIMFDRTAFIAGARAGDLPRMLAVYGGPFCASLSVGEARRFQEWMEEERGRLRALLREVAQRTLPTLLSAGPVTVAVSLARQLHALEPDDVATFAVLIDALIASGAVDEARERMVSTLSLRRSAGEPIPDLLLERARRLERWDPDAPPRRGTLDALGHQLVGRESAVQQLMVEAERARLGAPRRVLLTGPVGIGKTRLLDEVEARLRLRGARVVRVLLLPAMRQVRYAALSDVVRALVKLPGSLGIAEEAARELVSLVPELAARFPNAVPRAVEDGDRRRLLRLAVGELLSAVAEDRLVVLLIDDIVGADADSRLVLAGLPRAADLRLLEIIVARSGVRTEDLDPQRTLDLPPLGRDDLRAMLAEVVPLPQAAWVDPFLDAVMERSRGLPQIALQLIRSVADTQLLSPGEASWVCDDPERLLLEVQARSWLDEGLASLSPDAWRILQLLARWQVPMDEADLTAILGSGHDRVAEADLGAALRRIEALGFITSRDTTWAIAHASIADAVTARTGASDARSLLERLVGHWAVPDRLDIERLEHLALLCGTASNRALFARVARSASRAPRVRAIELRGRRLVRRLVRAAGRPEWEAEGLRAIGLLARLSDRGAAIFGASVMLSVGLLLWLALALQPRLRFEVEPMADGWGTSTLDLAVQPRVVMENGFGARYDWPIPVTIRVDGAEVLGDSVRAIRREGTQFDRLGIRVPRGQAPTRDLTLDAVGPWYVRPASVRVRGSRIAFDGETFRVVAAEIDGRPLGDSLVYAATGGDSLHIVLTFAYTTTVSTANYIVGAQASWRRRADEVIRLAGLPSPVVDAWRTVAFTVPAPSGPGPHYLVILFGAEDGVDYLFSLTNWTVGRPLWNDGNDVLDLGVEAFEALRRTGAANGVRRDDARYNFRVGRPWFLDSLPVPAEALYEVPLTLRGTALRIEVPAESPAAFGR